VNTPVGCVSKRANMLCLLDAV